MRKVKTRYGCSNTFERSDGDSPGHEVFIQPMGDLIWKEEQTRPRAGSTAVFLSDGVGHLNIKELWELLPVRLSVDSVVECGFSIGIIK